jgi:S1-C subfamily serine protease
MHDPGYPPQPTYQPAPVDAHEGNRPSIRSMIGVGVLSAALASVSTFGLISILGTGSSAAARPPTSGTLAAAVVNGDDSTDLSGVVARAKESVVTITAEGIGRSGGSAFDIPATGVGSGIVVSSNGLILTNNHVVEGARSLTVTTASGKDLSATVVVADQKNDMAIIRATGGDLTPATIGNSSQIEVGQTVLAIGSPLGEYTETVTRGIISALDRNITVNDQGSGAQEDLNGLIQTDAAINPGNSGGPLIDAGGNVVGMNTAVSREAEGIGFAIPIDAAKSLIDQAVASGA